MEAQPPAVRQTARSLALDLLTAEAVATLRGAGVRSIVLKGPAIARWLYADGSPRPYSDADLLVSPRRLPAAARALESTGWSPVLDAQLVPGAFGHHLALQRDGAMLDLHRCLPHVPAPAEAAWRLLSAATETTSIAGVEVEFLGVPARALHLALHATQHGALRPQTLEDLKRGLRLADEATWRAAAGLAEALGAQDAFAAGLRSIPEGAELATRLRLPPARLTTVVHMLAEGAPLRSINVQRLLCDRAPWEAARALLRTAVPSIRFMRFRYPAARRGRTALMAAYVRRLVSLARDAVPVLVSVMRAMVASRL